MADDVDKIWALVSGVLQLVMAVGVGAIVEGSTRRRSVATGAGRHLVTAAGAIGGSFGSAFLQETPLDDYEFWVLLTSSVLMAMIVSAAIVERGTFLAHSAIGAVVGALVAPGMQWAQSNDGVLSSISVGDQVFVDAAAATIFSATGWMGLVAVMVVGPRRGRLGADGQMRLVPGKSMPTASLGALLVLATSAGLIARPDMTWDDEILGAASLVALAAAVGGVASLALGWQRLGASSTASLVQGVVAGVVASVGAPLDLTVLRAVVLGAVAALVATISVSLVERAKIDDPVGVVGVFGAVGILGTLAATPTSSGVIAQLVGMLVIAAFAVVVSGVLFGGLRAVGLLRVSPEVEVVGLEN